MKRTLPVRRHAMALAALAALAPAAHAVDYNWSGGTFVSGSTAPNPLSASDTLNILTGAFKYFDGPGFVFTNNGTVRWGTTNALYMQNGAGVVNNGLWDSTVAHTLANNGGGALSFINNGTFRKSAGSGSVDIQAGTGFVNNGTLDAQSGSIEFQGGATFNNGSVFTGAGSNVVSAGTHTFNGSFTSGNLVLQGGTYTGTAAVLNGSASLSGGTLAGGWRVAAPATLNVATGAFKYVDGNVVNDGTINWDTTNFWYLQNGGKVTNNLLFSAAQSMSVINNGGASNFVNSATGTLRAEAGRTLTLGSTLGFINNAGVLDAASGATIAIDGGAQFNGATYSGAGVVVVDGTNSFSGTHSSANLRIVNGTQTGTAALLDGAVGWTGGLLKGGWTLNAGATLSAGTGAFKYLDTGTFTNNGTLAWNTTNALYMQNGARFDNRGLFVANAGASIINNGGAQPTFDNTASGTLRAAAGNTLGIGNMLVNNGGELNALAGAAIVYNGGATFNNNTRFTGAGVNRVDSDASFNGAISSANLVLQNGTLAGSNVALSGSATWNGGRHTGNWQLTAGSTLTAGTGPFKYIDGNTYTNNGTIAWGTTNALYLDNAAVLANNGLFSASVDTSVLNNVGTGSRLDNSAAGIVRAAGGSTLNIGTSLVNNGGQLDAEAAGSIRYAATATFNTGTRFIGAGSNVVASNAAFNGAISSANLVLDSGTFTGTAAVLSGNAGWIGGRLQGAWQIAPGATATVNTGAFKYLSGTGTVLDNRGTLVWNTTNALYLEDNVQLQNKGTIDIRADMTLVDNGGAGTPAFVNTGLILKSAGGGTATIQAGLGFDNQGTLDVRSGTLALPASFGNAGTLRGNGGYSVSGTLGNAGTLAPGAGLSVGTLGLSGNYAQTAAGTFAVDLQSLALHDLFNISGTAALNGTLAISCFGACSLAVGDSFTILDSVGDLSGTFASVTLSGFATGAFNVVYDTVADRVQLVVTQTVTAAVPEPGTYALLLAGIGAIGFIARRRRLG